ADDVAVLRRGKLVGKGRTAALTPGVLAELMVGTREIPRSHARKAGGPVEAGVPGLVIQDLKVEDDAGRLAVDGLSLPIRARAFGVKTPSADAPMTTLSGGNVQRAVLARELSEPVSVLIAANPVFGLDFAAVAEIHDRILAARNGGAAVLLVSEDLDELLELSDRITVIFDGRIVHESATAKAD